MHRGQGGKGMLMIKGHSRVTTVQNNNLSILQPQAESISPDSLSVESQRTMGSVDPDIVMLKLSTYGH
jgi:hypothetical protein